MLGSCPGARKGPRVGYQRACNGAGGRSGASWPSLWTRRRLPGRLAASDTLENPTAMPRAPDPRLRERLLAAAVRVFARAGYAAATLDAIAAEAAVTKGGIYFHFRGKEELFFAALDSVRAAERAAIQQPRALEATGAGELVAVIAAWLGFQFMATGAARLLGLLAGEVSDRPTARIRADPREDLRALRARLRQALVRGVSDGTLDVRDPVLCAFLLAAGARGIVAQWLAAPADVAEFGSAEDLAEALVEPLRTHAPPAEGSAAPGFLPRVDG